MPRSSPPPPAQSAPYSPPPADLAVCTVCACLSCMLALSCCFLGTDNEAAMVAPGCRRRIPLLRGEPNDDERPASNEPDDPSAAGGDSCGAGLGGRERCGGRGAVAEPCGGAVHEASSSVLSNAMRRCRAGGPALVGACAAKGLMRSLVRLSVRRACSCPSRSYLIVCDHLTCRYRERIPWCHLENFRVPAARRIFSRAYGACSARQEARRRASFMAIFIVIFGPFFLAWAAWRPSGRNVVNFFLLHQSTDLGELYPMV